MGNADKSAEELMFVVMLVKTSVAMNSVLRAKKSVKIDVHINNAIISVEKSVNCV